MKQEKFITRKPNNKFLHNYISYYYFHYSFDHSLNKRFIYYPGYKNALTIYKNSRVEYGNGYSKVEPDDRTNFIFIYSGMQRQLRTAYISAPFNKIGIVFQELGVNHFVNQPLSYISNHTIEKSFNYFGDHMINCCDAVYSEKEIDKKVNLLDSFFKEKFFDFHEEMVKQCVKIIIDSSKKITVKDLSNHLKVSRKTLLRLFNKHLCCSVKEYIDIVQFRKAINDYLIEKKRDSLTQLALENDYYDQPQFIKHFKKLTGSNPRTFFKNIEHIGHEDTFWTFE